MDAWFLVGVFAALSELPVSPFELFAFTGKSMRFDDEKEMENMIFQSIKDGCCLCTDETYSHVFQQFELRGYGVMDILGVTIYNDPELVSADIHIYELKNTKIDFHAVAQIARYKQGMKRYLENQFVTNADRERRVDVSVKGHLVGLGYKMESDVCFLVDSIPWLDCFFCEIAMGGVTFTESSGWFNKSEDFTWVNNKISDVVSDLSSMYSETINSRIEAQKRGCIRRA